jgi:hypothetical protein
MRFSVFPFCALLVAPIFAAETAYTLVDRWHVDFGRGDDRATYHTAVCPDGTFYLSDSLGRVGVIDAKGNVISRKVIREFATARSLVCLAESRVYVADPRNIFVMRGEVRVSRVRPDVFIAAIAPAADGTVYAAGSRRAGTLPLHWIDKEGSVVKSFGIEVGGQFNRMYPQGDGMLLWQEQIGRLLYIPRWRDFEVQAYRADGSSIGVFAAQGAHILPVRVSDAGDPPLGFAIGVAALPHDEIAVQREVAQWNWRARPSRMLEIYDSRLRRVGMAESDRRNLAGSSAAGDLYFTSLSPRGLQVFKVGLIRRLTL